MSVMFDKGDGFDEADGFDEDDGRYNEDWRRYPQPTWLILA